MCWGLYLAQWDVHCLVFASRRFPADIHFKKPCSPVATFTSLCGDISNINYFFVAFNLIETSISKCQIISVDFFSLPGLRTRLLDSWPECLLADKHGDTVVIRIRCFSVPSAQVTCVTQIFFKLSLALQKKEKKNKQTTLARWDLLEWQPITPSCKISGQ